MRDLPVMLNVRGRRCVVVGGGAVARRRAAALAAAGAQVTVIAPDVTFAEPGVAVERRAYHTGDLAGAFAVVIATDDPQVNAAAAEEARQAGVLINRADDPAAGDFTVPAHVHRGPITLAVHTGGVSPPAAAVIRDELAAALAPHWQTLLETIAPYRGRLQAACPDPAERQRRLTALSSGEAVEALRQGGVDGLRAYCEAIVGEAAREK